MVAFTHLPFFCIRFTLSSFLCSLPTRCVDDVIYGHDDVMYGMFGLRWIELLQIQSNHQRHRSPHSQQELGWTSCHTGIGVCVGGFTFCHVLVCS